MDVFEGITALADYGVRTGLIEEADRTWAVNALLAALELDAYEERTVTGQPALTEILDSLLNYACANGLCQDSVVYRDGSADPATLCGDPPILGSVRREPQGSHR